MSDEGKLTLWLPVIAVLAMAAGWLSYMIAFRYDDLFRPWNWFCPETVDADELSPAAAQQARARRQ